MSKSFGFGFRAFKRFPELIPLSAIISAACIGCAGFMGYALATKPDVQVFRSSGIPAYENVAPTESRKLRTVRKDLYVANEELEQLRREIGSYKTK